MRRLPVPLLALAFAMGPNATAFAQSSPRETGLRRIELQTGADGTEPEIHIRSGVSTVLTFDVKLAREQVGRLQAEVEREAAFTRVDSGESVLRLVPSDDLKPGERLRLTVRFEDGADPPNATFILEVSDEQADRLVEVFRAPRSQDSLHSEVREARAALQQCQEVLARAQSAPEGMTALRLANALDDGGVAARYLSTEASQVQRGNFMVKQLLTFRANRRVLIELTLRAREPGPPWTARNATLAGPHGELLTVLSLWQESPVTTDAQQRILIEAESNETLPAESWTLWLSEEGGGRALVLGGISFAPMSWSGAGSTQAGP